MIFRRLFLCPLRYSRSLSSQNRRSFASAIVKPFIDIHPEVQQALHEGKAITCLESALITHGLPYPTNLEVALSLEKIVRSTGAIPASISMLAGKIKVGMDQKDLEQLSDTKTTTQKLSRRDLGPAIASRANGGTTCAATLSMASQVGIKIFATGGLGGVHRGGENSLDISADLPELARSPVGLVSAGVKSILDIEKTLEYLETLGVPVISYGKTRDFPAFFAPISGFYTSWNAHDPSMAASMLYSQWQMGITCGALIAVPIPDEYQEVSLSIQRCIDQAIAESEANGISKMGKDVTPWILNRVAELSGGNSLESNIALLKHTALVGGQIAVEYQKLAKDNVLATTSSNKSNALRFDSHTFSVKNPSTQADTKLLIFGGTAVDLCATPSRDFVEHSTTAGKVDVKLGGVAQNVARAVTFMQYQGESNQDSMLFISPLGTDSFSQIVLSETGDLGMKTNFIRSKDARTAVVSMNFEHDGSLRDGVADMSCMSLLDPSTVLRHIKQDKAKLICMDGNVPEASILEGIKNLSDCQQLFFEPTSVEKSRCIMNALSNCPGRSVAFASPNMLELNAMHQTAETSNLTSHSSWWAKIDSFKLDEQYRLSLRRIARTAVSDIQPSKGTLQFLLDGGILQQGVKLLPFFQHLLIKLGSAGLLVIQRVPSSSQWAQEESTMKTIVHQGEEELIVLKHFPPLVVDNIVSVNGAGDTFSGAMLAHLLAAPELFKEPALLDQAINSAQQAAVLTLQSVEAVSPALRNLPQLHRQ